MSGPGADGESHSLRGPVDRAVLITVRDLFEEEEPLATATLDDFLNPTQLAIHLDDGVGDADTARIDVQWTTRADYAFHYTDAAELNVRWDSHPHDGEFVRADGSEHFHPPPDASSDPAAVEDSCIQQSVESLVARAVLKLWRTAYHTDSVEAFNEGENPP